MSSTGKFSDGGKKKKPSPAASGAEKEEGVDYRCEATKTKRKRKTKSGGRSLRGYTGKKIKNLSSRKDTS